MRARLAINNCFAVKRWPRPEDWASVVRDQVGLEWVELSLDLLGPDVGAQRGQTATKSALAAHGLRAATTFTGLGAYSLNLLMDPDPERREWSLDWYRRVIQTSAELGVTATGGHVGAMSVQDWSDPSRRLERWSGLQSDLAVLALAARRAGLDHLTLENLASAREPGTMAQVSQLLSRGDASHVPWRLCLDLGHQCVPGTGGAERDPYAWITRFGPELAELHLQQTDGRADHHWPFTREHAEHGLIRPERVVDELTAAAAGDVLLVLEVIPAAEQDDDQVLADLEVSAAVWKEALQSRGVASW